MKKTFSISKDVGRKLQMYALEQNIRASKVFQQATKGTLYSGEGFTPQQDIKDLARINRILIIDDEDFIKMRLNILELKVTKNTFIDNMIISYIERLK